MTKKSKAVIVKEILEHISPLLAKPKGDDVICSHCKEVIYLKNLVACSAMIEGIKYKLQCQTCKKVFETKWRAYPQYVAKTNGGD